MFERRVQSFRTRVQHQVITVAVKWGEGDNS